MKEQLKKILPTVIVAIAALVVVSLTRVGGGQIEGAADMNNTCLVTVEKYEHMQHEDKVTYTLTGDRIYELRALLLQSTFTRANADTVYPEDSDRYDIRVEYPDGSYVLRIECIGNEYILIPDQFDGNFLKNTTDGFESALLDILSRSEVG